MRGWIAWRPSCKSRGDYIVNWYGNCAYVRQGSVPRRDLHCCRYHVTVHRRGAASRPWHPCFLKGVAAHMHDLVCARYSPWVTNCGSLPTGGGPGRGDGGPGQGEHGHDCETGQDQATARGHALCCGRGQRPLLPGWVTQGRAHTGIMWGKLCVCACVCAYVGPVRRCALLLLGLLPQSTWSRCGGWSSPAASRRSAWTSSRTG